MIIPVQGNQWESYWYVYCLLFYGSNSIDSRDEHFPLIKRFPLSFEQNTKMYLEMKCVKLGPNS
jgi:hypothetical protein